MAFSEVVLQWPLKNRGKDTSLQRLIYDGCHCKKQLLQAFNKEGRGKWV